MSCAMNEWIAEINSENLQCKDTGCFESNCREMV
jgi:hypothetical protein